KVFLLVLGRKVRPIQIRKAVRVDRKVLERYVGEYRLTPHAKFTITLEGDHLFARLTGQSVVRIYASTKTRFFYRVVKAEIEFQLDTDGRVTGRVLHQNGRKPAKKIE
ncbi:MAG: DUF3471 domain-containing protein, partial [Planctomycetota bacterium]